MLGSYYSIGPGVVDIFASRGTGSGLPYRRPRSSAVDGFPLTSGHCYGLDVETRIVSHSFASGRLELRIIDGLDVSFAKIMPARYESMQVFLTTS